MAKPPGRTQQVDFTDTFTISVGDYGKRFTIHTDIVTTSSSHFLKAALSHDWKEAVEQHITLHEVDTPALEGYLHWLYTDCILEKHEATRYRELFAFYLLGDYLEDMVFCERVVEAIVTLWHAYLYPPFELDVAFVWERTLPTSPLRRVIREIWLAMPLGWSFGVLKEFSGSQQTIDFIREFCRGLGERRLREHVEPSSWADKNPEQIKAVCRSFVRDAAS